MVYFFLGFHNNRYDHPNQPTSHKQPWQQTTTTNRTATTSTATTTSSKTNQNVDDQPRRPQLYQDHHYLHDNQYTVTTIPTTTPPSPLTLRPYLGNIFLCNWFTFIIFLKRILWTMAYWGLFRYNFTVNLEEHTIWLYSPRRFFFVFLHFCIFDLNGYLFLFPRLKIGE